MNSFDQSTTENSWHVTTKGNLSDFLNSFSASTEPIAHKIFSDREQDISALPASVAALYDEARRLIYGGKKLRGALVTLGFIIAKGSPHLQQRILEVSIGYELLHNSFLVHDDVMDRGRIRRNQPASWVKFAGSSASPDEHYGMSQAINLGDMMAFWLVPLVANPGFPVTHISRALSLISRCIETTVIGQALDIDPSVSITDPSDEHILTIARNKTALYSIVVPLQLGAILGGLPEGSPVFTSIRDFGIPLGMAFQFQDDILGLYGTEEELGKSVTSDLVEGKKTIFFWELYHRLSEEDKQRFRSLWGNPGVTEADFEWTKDIGKTSGALDIMIQRNNSLVAQASAVLPQISDEPSIRGLMLELADFVVQRTY